MSLVPVHSYTINDCYIVLYLPLKFVPYIQDHFIYIYEVEVKHSHNNSTKNERLITNELQLIQKIKTIKITKWT